MWKCQWCGAENPEGNDYCGKCGTILSFARARVYYWAFFGVMMVFWAFFMIMAYLGYKASGQAHFLGIVIAMILAVPVFFAMIRWRVGTYRQHK